MSSKSKRTQKRFTPPTSKQLDHKPITTQSFEEMQIRHLQLMVSFLAHKAYLSLEELDCELKPEAFPQLRIYAQYLNLYLKFKDKCCNGESSKQPDLKPVPSKEINLSDMNQEIVELSHQTGSEELPPNQNTTQNGRRDVKPKPGILMPPANGIAIENNCRHKRDTVHNVGQHPGIPHK